MVFTDFRDGEEKTIPSPSRDNFLPAKFLKRAIDANFQHDNLKLELYLMSQASTKNSRIFLPPSQIRKLFDLSNYLSDLTEELLEENTHYSQEFIKGLKKSEKDLRKGKIRKVKSLHDLL